LRESHPNHQYVAGIQGTGKTTYLSKLVEISKAEGFLTAMPALEQAAASRAHVSTIMWKLVRELQDRLNGNYLEDWEAGSKSKYFSMPRSEDLDSNRLQEDFKKIEKLMKENKIPGAVICIDEGQRIDGRALSVLKNSLQSLKSYLIVLSYGWQRTKEERLLKDAGG